MRFFSPSSFDLWFAESTNTEGWLCIYIYTYIKIHNTYIYIIFNLKLCRSDVSPEEKDVLIEEWWNCTFGRVALPLASTAGFYQVDQRDPLLERRSLNKPTTGWQDATGDTNALRVSRLHSAFSWSEQKLPPNTCKAFENVLGFWGPRGSFICQTVSGVPDLVKCDSPKPVSNKDPNTMRIVCKLLVRLTVAKPPGRQRKESCLIYSTFGPSGPLIQRFLYLRFGTSRFLSWTSSWSFCWILYLALLCPSFPLLPTLRINKSLEVVFLGKHVTSFITKSSVGK